MKAESIAQKDGRRFYRFRSLKRLLGENGELASQTIYFPHPSTLNDPMEGYIDVYWKGDRVLWINFFRHYLRVYSNCFILSRVTKDSSVFEGSNFFINSFSRNFLRPEAKDLFEEISATFFGSEVVEYLVQSLSERQLPSTEEEVLFYLETISDLAFAATMDRMRDRGMLPSREDLFPIANVRLIEIMGEGFFSGIDWAQSASMLQSIFAAAKCFSESHKLFLDQDGTYDPLSRILVREFPAKFLKEVRRLIHPEWYAACFMGDYKNASVWGTYGENYTGVCLIFEPKETGGGGDIKLYGKYAEGYSRDADGDFDSRPILGHVDMRFHKIDYVSKHVRVDFFSSLGRLPVTVLSEDWYQFQGSRSKEAGVDNSEEFRSGYWASFVRAITKKLNDWSHEDEYRLILFGSEISYAQKEDRVFRYDFNDLHGVIFGMRTPADERREIVSLIKEKCKQQGRAEFSFYQSYYSSQSGKIEIVKLPGFWRSGEL